MDIADRAEEDIERSIAAAEAQSRAACSRESDGICVDCGDPIPVDRMLAAPFACRCIGCQADWERQGR